MPAKQLTEKRKKEKNSNVSFNCYKHFPFNRTRKIHRNIHRYSNRFEIHLETKQTDKTSSSSFIIQKRMYDIIRSIILSEYPVIQWMDLYIRNLNSHFVFVRCHLQLHVSHSIVLKYNCMFDLLINAYKFFDKYDWLGLYFVSISIVYVIFITYNLQQMKSHLFPEKSAIRNIIFDFLIRSQSPK